jgi:hypothetical protein
MDFNGYDSNLEESKIDIKSELNDSNAVKANGSQGNITFQPAQS